MIDKELFKLIGGNKKYIFTAVLTQVIGLVANVAVTGSVCYAVYLLTVSAAYSEFVYPLIGAVLGIAIRYICSRLTGEIKDKLGRRSKRPQREGVRQNSKARRENYRRNEHGRLDAGCG